MKKIIFIFLLIYACIDANAQVPQAINFQGTAYDLNGKVVSNHDMSARITLDTTGTFVSPLYQETRQLAKHPLGAFSFQINQLPRTVVYGNFNALPWNSGKVQMKVEIDITGNNNFSNNPMVLQPSIGTVPYAFTTDSITSMNLKGAANGDILYWDSVSGKWNHVKPAIGTAYSDGTGIHISGTQINNTIPNLPNDALNYNSSTGVLSITDNGGTNTKTTNIFNPWADYALYEEKRNDNDTSHNSNRVSGIWSTVSLNYTQDSLGSHISRIGNVVSLDAGKYYVKAVMKGRYGINNASIDLNLKLRNTSNGNTTALSGMGESIGSALPAGNETNYGYYIPLEGFVNISSTSYFDLQYWYYSGNNLGLNFYTDRVPNDGEPEIFTTLFIQRIAN